jgi:hypothetical protein
MQRGGGREGQRFGNITHTRRNHAATAHAPGMQHPRPKNRERPRRSRMSCTEFCMVWVLSSLPVLVYRCVGVLSEEQAQRIYGSTAVDRDSAASDC